MLNKNNWMAQKLRSHIGHSVACVHYGDPENPADICIECEDCNEVLVSAEDFNEPESEAPLACGLAYETMFGKRHRGEISEAEFQKWYSDNCAKCRYMGEICMYGEE